MGCCGEKANLLYNEFIIELLTLIPESNQSIFKIKEIESTKFNKEIEKKLIEYISESKIFRNNYLKENFRFNINNSLFYCYLSNKPIIYNYLQIKDLEPYNYDNLYKISILLTINFDRLFLPKLILKNKTKFCSKLQGLKLDFSQIINSEIIMDTQLTNDNMILTKPQLTEDLSDINNNNSSAYLRQQENEEENYSDSNGVDNEKVILKNYIHISGELTSKILKDVYSKLSFCIKEYNLNENENEELNKENGDICNTKKIDNEISVEKENIYNKKDREIISLKLENKNDSKISYKIKNNIKTNEKDSIIIDSIYLENMNIENNFELFSDLIDIISTYPLLKKLSFCESTFEKDFFGWDNIIHLINQSQNLRWLDFHKSNINNIILNEILKSLENKRIRYLDLSENFINKNGAKNIGIFLQKNKTVQRLILNNNDLEEFKNEGIEYICGPLYNHPHIELINFSSMIITGCGESISQLIKHTKSLKTIILRECSLNLKDFQNICRAMCSNNISKTIINVDLSFNDMASDKSIEEIGQMIKSNKNLTTLNMDKMNLNMNNYNIILNALNENDKIIDFSFCYNPQIKPKVILEYFLYRKFINSLSYVPYKSDINLKNEKIEFSLDEKKIIEKFQKNRKEVKLIVNE